MSNTAAVLWYLLLLLCRSETIPNTTSNVEYTTKSGESTQYFTTATSDRQYIFVSTSMTWNDAKLYCDENYDGLATILTLNEFNDVLDVILSSSTWIGLNDLNAEGVWEWDDKSPCFYNSTDGHDCSDYWLTLNNQPDNGGGGSTKENCGELNNEWGGIVRGYSLNDRACSYIQSAVCQQTAVPITSIPTTANPTTATPTAPTTTNREYIFMSTLRTWYDAKLYCDEYYDGLATILTLDQFNDAIDVTFSSSTWIGLNDLDTEAVWEWDDKSKCIYNSTDGHDCSDYWLALNNQPDNGGYGGGEEDCGELNNDWGGIVRGYSINDRDCSYMQSSLCQQTYNPILAAPTPSDHDSTTTQTVIAKSSNDSTLGLVIVIVVILTVFVMIIMYFIWRRNKNQNKIQQQVVAMKNLELEEIHKNTFNDTYKEDIRPSAPQIIDNDMEEIAKRKHKEMEEMYDRNNKDCDKNSNISLKPSCPPTEDINEDKTEEEKENDDGNMCILCVDKVANMCNNPCGHVSFCDACYDQRKNQMDKCPQCRKDIINCIKLFKAGF